MDTGRNTFKIASIGGIAVKVHWSWLLILALLTWGLSTLRFPETIPGQDPISYWALGVVAAILFFASVLLHELCHSFTARARGYKVHDITLFIFGGVSSIEGEPKTAGDEFWIAVVGPLSSIILAVFFFGLGLLVAPTGGQPGALGAIFSYLALVNLLLGLFNMIPGFPLDGGRVLRAIIWGVRHDFQSATRIAGFIGQLVAYGFIFLGLYITFFSADLSGLWYAFIGWFLLNAAQQSVTGVVMREVMRGVTVSQVWEQAPPAAAPGMTLAQLLTQYILPYSLRAVPVTQDGRLVGIVTLSDIKDVPQDQWGMATVGQLMTGGDKLRVVHPNDGLDRVMELFAEGDFDQ